MYEELKKIATILNIEISPAQSDALLAYVDLIIEEGQRTNLTGSKDPASFVPGPLFDALTVIPLIKPEGTFVDIGAGGGLPGIPIIILSPGLEVTLVEPRQKRVQFLRHIISQLNLRATVLHTQDRELPANQWDGAIAQAVFPPKKWLQRGKRLISNGGSVYVLSSSKVAPSMLPNGVTIEKELYFERPLDGASRYSYRVKVEKAS